MFGREPDCLAIEALGFGEITEFLDDAAEIP